MNQKASLKDQLFNAQKVHQIATEIKTVYQGFEQQAFEEETLTAFQHLELKARISHICEMLAKYLPNDYQLKQKYLSIIFNLRIKRYT